MTKKRKGELPSGNIRKKVYDHSELCFDEHGNPIIDPKQGDKEIKNIYPLLEKLSQKQTS